MKKFLITIFLLCLFSESYGQKKSEDLDKMYFLIGTLSDYMGYERSENLKDRVDKYYGGEKSLSVFIDSSFNNTYPDLVSIKTNNMGWHELHSEILAEEIDKYYSYKPSGMMAKSDVNLDSINFDNLTIDFYKENFDTIYSGNIRSDIFQNDVQKFSFITGVYIRFGEGKDSNYSIKIYNSGGKAKLFANLLEELGATNVQYKLVKNIPTNHIVNFTPSNELKKYFNKYAYLMDTN